MKKNIETNERMILNATPTDKELKRFEKIHKMVKNEAQLKAAYLIEESASDMHALLTYLYCESDHPLFFQRQILQTMRDIKEILVEIRSSTNFIQTELANKESQI